MSTCSVYPLCKTPCVLECQLLRHHLHAQRIPKFILFRISRKVHSTHLDSRLSNCMWQGFWFGSKKKQNVKVQIQGPTMVSRLKGVATTGPILLVFEAATGNEHLLQQLDFWRDKVTLNSQKLDVPPPQVLCWIFYMIFQWNGMSMQNFRTFLFCGRCTCQQSIVLCRKKTSPHCRRLVYDCQAKQMLATLGLDSVPEACMYGLGGFFWVKTCFILVLECWWENPMGRFGQQESAPIQNISWYLEPQEIEKQIELEGMEGEETQAWYSCRRSG